MVTTQVRLRDPQHWLFKREVAGGGILTWLACHWLDLIRYISGEEFTRVGAELATLSDEPITVEDTAAVTFRLSGGAVGACTPGISSPPATRATRGRTPTGRSSCAAAMGRSATIAARRTSRCGWRATRRGGRTRRRASTTSPRPPRAATAGWPGGLLPRLPGRRPRRPHSRRADDALRVLELLEAIYEAGRTGRTVEVAHRAV